MAPARWPIAPGRETERFFADGGFFTADGKARMLPVAQKPPAQKTTPRYPFRLNTGRVRDQWHTMTRTARAPRLTRHLAEPFLQLHPEDAARLSLGAADLAVVESPSGSAILRVLISEDVSAGVPFAPMHWTGETAPAARIGPVIAAALDPISGQPESKASVVNLRRFQARWYGFAISQTRFQPETRYWAQLKTEGGWRAELAEVGDQADWAGYASALFGLDAAPEVFADDARGERRVAFRENGVLRAALFVAREPVRVARDFVAGLLGHPAECILAAKPGGEQRDPGPTVCACMSVGRNHIVDAIAAGGDLSLDAICDVTGAGTNCGSCRPEVAEIIARSAPKLAAE
jgi:assimilatory nitrate reductase catalytic subunit